MTKPMCNLDSTHEESARLPHAHEWGGSPHPEAWCALQFADLPSDVIAVVAEVRFSLESYNGYPRDCSLDRYGALKKVYL